MFCLSTIYVPAAQKGQKNVSRLSEALELELEMVVNHHMSARLEPEE